MQLCEMSESELQEAFEIVSQELVDEMRRYNSFDYWSDAEFAEFETYFRDTEAYLKAVEQAIERAQNGMQP